jgi:hypothetical protein
MSNHTTNKVMERVYDEVTKRALDVALADADQEKRKRGDPSLSTR